MGEVMAIISITGSLFPSIANLALVAIPINEAKIAFDRMFEIIGQKGEPEKSENQYVKIEDVNRFVLSDIDFRFVGRKRLLNGINMEFNKGELTCIIGESGCGKSTLCQIMQRFYQPESGVMLIDDMNVETYSLSEWRHTIAVVPQEIFIYNGTPY
ncbi:hypothetical protein FACS1894201_03810 [Bacteroidia bacterium]|nr:hypothetical protein FACS1894201_03810 [Bacteroidia bacterium]